MKNNFNINERLTTTASAPKKPIAEVRSKLETKQNNDFRYQVERYLKLHCTYYKATLKDTEGFRINHPQKNKFYNYDKFLKLYSELLKKYGTRKPYGYLTAHFTNNICIIYDHANPYNDIFFKKGSVNPDENTSDEVKIALKALANNSINGIGLFSYYMDVINKACVNDPINNKKLLYELRRINDIPASRDEDDYSGAKMVMTESELNMLVNIFSKVKLNERLIVSVNNINKI